MHVLFVTHNYPRRAGDYAGVFLHTLARYLIRESIRVSVIAPHDAGAPEHEVMEGVSVYRARYGSDSSETFAYRGNMHRQLFSFSGFGKFRRLTGAMGQLTEQVAVDEKVDLIHSHWVIPSAPVVNAVFKKTGIPYIISSHGTDMRILKKLTPARMYVRNSLFDARSLTVVSSFLRDDAIRLFPDLSEKIEVLPLPNDAAIFYRDEAIARESDLLVSVTRFTNQKRVNVLVDACDILAHANVNFRLELYGSGPLEDDIRQKINRLNLQDRITIHAPIPQVKLRGIYNRAQAVALNSVDEGFGLTLVEAALCGSLPVGVRSGGIADIITHQETGLLAEPDNPQSLAQQLRTAFAERELVTQLADNARKNANEKFTGAAVARRFVNVYQKALVA